MSSASIRLGNGTKMEPKLKKNGAPWTIPTPDLQIRSKSKGKLK